MTDDHMELEQGTAHWRCYKMTGRHLTSNRDSMPDALQKFTAKNLLKMNF